MSQSELAGPRWPREGEVLGAVGRRVGSGGDADVFRAELDGADVALKIARGRATHLAREALVLALAGSPWTPRALGVGWVREDAGAWIATEAGPGARPALALEWRSQGAARGSRETVLHVAHDVAGALADAHALGIAHGDVKSENVVVSRAGRATLIDWGLACPAHRREIEGGTLRILPTRDADVGDARARDLLALGLLLVEWLHPDLAAREDFVEAARSLALEEPVATIVSALLVPSPTARPGARWVEQLTAGLLGHELDRGSSARSERWVRVTHLRARRHSLRGVAGGDSAPWLAPALAWHEAIGRLDPGDLGPRRAEPTPPITSDEVVAWIGTLVGPSAASWPTGRLADAGEAALARGLTALARAKDPSGWTLAEVERAVLEGDTSRGIERRAAESEAERAARLAIEISETPPRSDAVEEVERDPTAPRALVVAAANALRLSSQLGRARALLRRSGAVDTALSADVSRRAGAVEEARTAASRALLDDPDGRAHAVLGRLAFDAGDLDGALRLVASTPGAATAEVEALTSSHRGLTQAALDALTRGEAYARSSEDRARLAGTRGYVLASVRPAQALDAFRKAVDHAVFAGMLTEESTYRTGQAACAVDEGHLSEGIAEGTRAARLWDALGRPASAARAMLAVAAAHAALGASYETESAASTAIALARDAADPRAEAYAWMSIADVARPGAPRGLDAARAAERCLGAEPGPDDRLRVAARLLAHGAEVPVDELDALADQPSATASARLDWWGVRARERARTGASATAADAHILSAVVGLGNEAAALTSRGPALSSALALATATGRSDVADRLRPALRDAARTLVARVGAELVGKATELGWVVANLTAEGSAMDAEQVRELEHLVRSLGNGERLGPLLRRVLDALVLWTGVERGLLLLRTPEGRLVPRAARNFARADLRGDQAALSQTLARRALDALEPVVAVDAAGELPSFHDSVHALRLRSVLAVPLVARGEAIGVAYLDDRVRRGAFGPKELAWTRTIAALASSMIADARDQVLLRRAVRTAKRNGERLADALAEREAKLFAAEQTLERTAQGTGSRRHAEIVGESDAMQRLLRTLDRVAVSDVPVLVVGESGSGKELVARAIHATSARSSRPFVGENCGAIPEGLLESALFGHVRGAFTGADRSRVGLFEAADGGTLFLDEVGEMSLAMQAKLLRILEDGMVRPLGTERAKKVDVRVIAATHRDLEAMVRERRFREDLFYRLNIISLRVPPLRERPGDIPLLVKRFVDKHGRGRVTVARGAMQRLVAYGWPGNVRQLENEIRRALVLCDKVIEREHLSPEIDEGPTGAIADAGLNVRRRVDLLEATLVKDALERTKGNQTQAAKLLGLSRFGLQKMMKRLAIALP